MKDKGYKETLKRIAYCLEHKISSLDLSNLNLKDLPLEISNLTQLEELRLSNNNLQTLPPEIGNLGGLQELYLGHNRLQHLPPEINNLTELRKLYLAGNQFPNSLFKNKTLSRKIVYKKVRNMTYNK